MPAHGRQDEMSKVAVTINGRKYDIACDDGQEAHLARLSQYIDKRVDELVEFGEEVDEALDEKAG